MVKLINKLYLSTKWSLAGLSYAFKNEMSFRIEVVVALILTPVAFFVGNDLNQILWLLMSLHMVLVIELVNTAIEATIDRIGDERHNLSMHAKDAGSAAVFYAVLIATVIWGLMIYFNILTKFI